MITIEYKEFRLHLNPYKNVCSFKLNSQDCVTTLAQAKRQIDEFWSNKELRMKARQDLLSEIQRQCGR